MPDHSFRSPFAGCPSFPVPEPTPTFTSVGTLLGKLLQKAAELNSSGRWYPVTGDTKFTTELTALFYEHTHTGGDCFYAPIPPQLGLTHWETWEGKPLQWRSLDAALHRLWPLGSSAAIPPQDLIAGPLGVSLVIKLLQRVHLATDPLRRPQDREETLSERLLAGDALQERRRWENALLKAFDTLPTVTITPRTLPREILALIVKLALKPPLSKIQFGILKTLQGAGNRMLYSVAEEVFRRSIQIAEPAHVAWLRRMPSATQARLKELYLSYPERPNPKAISDQLEAVTECLNVSGRIQTLGVWGGAVESSWLALSLQGLSALELDRTTFASWDPKVQSPFNIKHLDLNRTRTDQNGPSMLDCILAGSAPSLASLTIIESFDTRLPLPHLPNLTFLSFKTRLSDKKWPDALRQAVFPSLQVLEMEFPRFPAPALEQPILNWLSQPSLKTVRVVGDLTRNNYDMVDTSLKVWVNELFRGMGSGTCAVFVVNHDPNPPVWKIGRVQWSDAEWAVVEAEARGFGVDAALEVIVETIDVSGPPNLGLGVRPWYHGEVDWDAEWVTGSGGESDGE